MPHAGSRPSSGSFALVELAVAMAVLAILMTTVASAVAFSRAALRRAQRAAAAQSIADHQIALVRAAAAEGQRIANVTDQERPPGLLPAERIPDLHCLVTIQDMDADHPGLKHVTVRVTWSVQGRGLLEIVRETLVAERIPWVPRRTEQ
jgi:type II secretory pathway pseudopilin PulG